MVAMERDETESTIRTSPPRPLLVAPIGGAFHRKALNKTGSVSFVPEARAGSVALLKQSPASAGPRALLASANIGEATRP